jgi:hypothetical protein
LEVDGKSEEDANKIFDHIRRFIKAEPVNLRYIKTDKNIEALNKPLSLSADAPPDPLDGISPERKRELGLKSAEESTPQITPERRAELGIA